MMHIRLVLVKGCEMAVVVVSVCLVVVKGCEMAAAVVVHLPHERVTAALTASCVSQRDLVRASWNSS